MWQGKKYNIIYADPPWQYHAWQKKNHKTAEKHYTTVSICNLADLPIDKIADKNSVLLMWVTFPCLREGFKLGKAWGFTYKTVAFTWVKMNKNNGGPFIGLGHYTRSNAEIVLLFTRGKPLKRLSRNIQQIIFTKTGRHSQKPHEVRKRIVALFGDLPRLELFARTRDGLFGNDEYAGWDVYGNQINGSIRLPEK